MTQLGERPAVHSNALAEAAAASVHPAPLIQQLQGYRQRLIEELCHVERQIQSLGGTVHPVVPDGFWR